MDCNLKKLGQRFQIVSLCQWEIPSARFLFDTLIKSLLLLLGESPKTSHIFLSLRKFT